MKSKGSEDIEKKALEDALKASSREVLSLKKQLEEMQDKCNAASKKAETLENIVSVLNMKIREKEMNFRMEQFLLFARKSEKFSKAEMDAMSRLVREMDETPSNDMGISKEESEDSPAEPEPAQEKEKKEPEKPWGRQKNVKTCGRNMDFIGKLESEEKDYDLKKSKDIDPEYAASLKLIRAKEKCQIDFIPCHLRTKKTVIYLYHDRDGKVVSLSPEEHDLIQGSKLTNRAIASVISDKILFGLPLNRTARKLNMMCGFSAVSAALLTSNYLKTAAFLSPVYSRMIELSRKGKIAHSDETYLSVVHERESGGRKQGYIWALLSESPNKISTFTFYPSRSAESGRQHLEGLSCQALQTDAYAVYPKIIKEMNEALARQVEAEEGPKGSGDFRQESDKLLRKGIVLVGCMAHARRLFYRLFYSSYQQVPDSEGYQTCFSSLTRIAEVYAIEDALRRKLKSGEITEEEFVSLRKAQAGPVIASLKAYAEQRKEKHQCEPKLSEAIGYLLNQIDIIANYLEFAELTPDNNAQERSIRSVTVTRAASMFASTSEGAEAWAKLLTILQTAEMNKINPTEYLAYLMDQIALCNHEGKLEKDICWDDFMPWNLKGKIKPLLTKS